MVHGVAFRLAGGDGTVEGPSSAPHHDQMFVWWVGVERGQREGQQGAARRIDTGPLEQGSVALAK